MRVKVTLTDGDGTVYEGEVELSPVVPVVERNNSPSRRAKASTNALSFSMNERAFVKKYARSLSGPKKFVLMMAYLVQGQVGKEIELREIEKHWSRMTASNLLGMAFNRFYSTSAKEDGWVDTKKKGFYFLCSTWQEVLA